MIIVLLAAWVLSGLLLALLVGGAVRIATAGTGSPMPSSRARSATRSPA